MQTYFGRLTSLFVSMTVVFAVTSCGGANTGTFVPSDASVSDDTGFGIGFFNDDGVHMACVPKTCAELGYTCGMTGDGGGGALDLGGCPAGQTCRGGRLHPFA